jgi:hypothetical protein
MCGDSVEDLYATMSRDEGGVKPVIERLASGILRVFPVDGIDDIFDSQAES